MITRCTQLRPLTLVFAMLMMAATLALNVSTAQAKCCTIYFNSTASCKFTAVLDNGASESIVVIYPGLNKFDIAGCGAWSLTVTDRCTGRDFVFPRISCADLSVAPGCCINICADAYNPCVWNVTNSYACACD